MVGCRGKASLGGSGGLGFGQNQIFLRHFGDLSWQLYYQLYYRHRQERDGDRDREKKLQKEERWGAEGRRSWGEGHTKIREGGRGGGGGEKRNRKKREKKMGGSNA